MTKFTYEEFLKLKDQLGGRKTSKSTFMREFEFSAQGRGYKIHWMINVSTLKIGLVEIRFDHYEVNGFWPNAYSKNLVVGFNGDNSAIVPLEK